MFAESFLKVWSKCTDKAPPVICGLQYSLATVEVAGCHTQVDQIVKVQQLLLTRGYKILAIGGDSAGANLSITSMFKQQQMLQTDGISSPYPPCGILISPATDFHMTADSFTRNMQKDFLNFKWMTKCRRAFIIGRPLGVGTPEEEQQFQLGMSNPLISPLFASSEQLLKLPPMLVIGGKDEALYDDICSFVRATRKALTAAGRTDSVEFIEGEGEAHIYPYLIFGRARRDMFMRIVNFVLKNNCHHKSSV